MGVNKASIFFCFFVFICGDNINFVSADGIDSADGLSPTSAQPLRSALRRSLTSFQKVYVLPGMYKVKDEDWIKDHDIEIVGSIRSDVAYGFSNASADPDTVDSLYDIDDIETVMNSRSYITSFIAFDGGNLAQIRRIRFLGVESNEAAVIRIMNSEVTMRMCYFAGNRTVFNVSDTNAVLKVKWCVFKRNTWNTMGCLAIQMNFGKSLLVEDCFFENITNGRGAVLRAGVLYNTAEIIESVTMRNCDVRNCRGWNALLFRGVRTIAIRHCSFGNVRSSQFSAVLYLWGPPPLPLTEFSFVMEDVVIWNNTAAEPLGLLFRAENFTTSPFTTDSIINVTYYPRELSSDLVLNRYGTTDTDNSSVISAGDNVEVWFTNLTDGVHTLADFHDFDILSDYVIISNNTNNNTDNNDNIKKKEDDKEPFPVWLIVLLAFAGLGVIATFVFIGIYCYKGHTSGRFQSDWDRSHHRGRSRAREISSFSSSEPSSSLSSSSESSSPVESSVPVSSDADAPGPAVTSYPADPSYPAVEYQSTQEYPPPPLPD